MQDKEAIMKLKERLENLSNQKEQLQIAIIKVAGAIELVNIMIKEEETTESKKEKPKDKKDK